MNRVLSFPQSHSCDDPAEVVSKRFCFSCLFSVAFLSLICGFLLGSRRNEVKFVPVSKDIRYSYTDVFSHFARDLPTPLTNTSDRIDAYNLHKYLDEYKLDELSRITCYNVTLTFSDETASDYLAVIESNGTERYRKIPTRNITSFHDRRTIPRSAETRTFANIVSGKPIYANFGTSEDFQYLIERGISLRDRIAILKLGKISIREKVTESLKWGIKGILLFDSRQYLENDCSESNRATISPVVLADLLEKSAPRDFNHCSQNCSIAIQIIEQDVAERLFLDMIPTRDTPVSWRGSSNVSYNIGPGFVSDQWRLIVRTNFANMQYTATDFIGYLTSPIEPDRYVIVVHGRSNGNQTDTSIDIFTRVAKSLAKLKSAGWTPKRTVVFGSFDSADIENNFEKSWLNENSRVMTQRAVALFYIRQSVGEKQRVDIVVSESLRTFFANVLSSVKTAPEIDSKMSESLSSELQDERRNETNECSQNYPNEKSDHDRNQLYAMSATLALPVLSFDYQTENTSSGNISTNDDESIARLWTLLTFHAANDALLPFDVASFVTILKESEEIVRAFSERNERLYEDFGLFKVNVDSAVDGLAKFHQEMEKFDVNDRSIKRRILNDKLMQLEKLVNCVKMATAGLGASLKTHIVTEIEENALSRGIRCLTDIDGILK